KEPVFEARLAEPRFIARNQRLLAHLDAVVARAQVSDHLAGILARRQVAPNDLIQTKLFRPADFHNAFHGCAGGDSGQGSGYIIGGHRLEEYRRQPYIFAIGGEIGDALDEFEKLRRADDRVRNGGGFDEILLSEFSAEETAFDEAVRSHDR